MVGRSVVAAVTSVRIRTLTPTQSGGWFSGERGTHWVAPIAGIALMEEQGFCKAQVVGSSPTVGTSG